MSGLVCPAIYEFTERINPPRAPSLLQFAAAGAVRRFRLLMWWTAPARGAMIVRRVETHLSR